MRWGHDFTSWTGVLVAVVCGVALGAYAGAIVWASVRQARAASRFGEAGLVSKLVTYDATARRALKSVLLVTAMLLTFVALARPQFGSGTKIVPATNLDVVIVLDYSKSMYARDIVPNRIARAKAEVARLIHDLPGARFGAVAFAGEPMSFPLSSDGAAIAQFFRQLEPNDMPVGGTATARALERAREVFEHDPKSKDHVRVVVLVTDGEDLEGDPVSVAERCKSEGTRIDVVQIGGRAPEVVPDVAPDGRITGVRKDDDGKPLTTQLSAEGEAQLARVAQVTGGTIVRAEHGETGIDQVARGLQTLMREELSEKVETVYAEEYAWPLGMAVVLFVLEALLGDAPKRKRAVLASLGAPLAVLFLVSSCGWDPSRPFDRDSPAVRAAMDDLDAGDASSAASRLEDYLSTGPCKEGSIGVPDLLKRRPDGTFDLGLSLFRIGEHFGRRFGEEEVEGGIDDARKSQRHDQIECARRVVEAIADDSSVPLELRARAHYLAGNLAFLDGEYEQAVRAYNRALTLVPGVADGGDAVGRDSAWNRAIALRRIEDKDKKDAGPDSGDAASPDASPPDGGDGGRPSQDAGHDGGKGEGQDAASGGDDAGSSGQDAAPSTPPDAGSEPPDAAAQPPPPTTSEDERMLDQLENAPTLQQEEAKRGGKRHVRGMADK